MRGFSQTSLFALCLPLLAGLLVMAMPRPAQAQNAVPEQNQRVLPDEAYAPENVPQEYIDEALEFETYCEGRKVMREHYDCQCLAARYIDKKVESAGRAGRSSIMLALENECADATEAAGMRYQECLSNISLMSFQGSPEEFCTCFANEYAKIYKQVGQPPGSALFTAIQSRAMLTCQNPNLAKRIYQ